MDMILNEAAHLIHHIYKCLRKNEKGKDARLSLLSHEVAPTGIEPISRV